jgi:hypothetical protein
LVTKVSPTPIVPHLFQEIIHPIAHFVRSLTFSASGHKWFYANNFSKWSSSQSTVSTTMVCISSVLCLLHIASRAHSSASPYKPAR